MKNVIAFPEKKMKKVKREQRNRATQAVLSLSLVTLMMGALLINDSLNRSQRPQYIVTDNTSASDIQKLNRAIASAQPMNPFRDLEWEKKIAERLGQDAIETRTPASIGRNANSIEQLRFGPLAGKYRLMDKPGTATPKLEEITYVDSAEVTDRPVYLDPHEFLRDYGALLAIDFEMFDRANPNLDQIKEYRLLNSSKKVVGTASFVLDDEGRFISLKVRSASENQ